MVGWGIDIKTLDIEVDLLRTLRNLFSYTGKKMMKSTDDKNLEIIVTNGYDRDSFVQDTQNDIHASSSLNGRSAEEVNPVGESLEQSGKITVCLHRGIIPL